MCGDLINTPLKEPTQVKGNNQKETKQVTTLSGGVDENMWELGLGIHHGRWVGSLPLSSPPLSITQPYATVRCAWVGRYGDESLKM